MKKLYITLSTYFICFILHAQCDLRFESEISGDFIVHKDLLYGNNVNSEGQDVTLLMDIYEPSISEIENNRPIILLAHGGSFSSGSKESSEVRWFCEDLAKRGIVTASINYRLEPSLLSLLSREKMIKAVIRATEDVKAAIRFIHKDIEGTNPYRINKDEIFVGGSSAGSIAVLHAVFMDQFYKIPNNYQDWILELSGDTTLSGQSGNPGFSEEIAGVINISGAILSTKHLNNNVGIPILSIHNEWDFTIPFGLGHPYQLPFLPNVMGSSHIHYQMTSIGGYSRLYKVSEINHVPHTYPNDVKNQPVYNRSMKEITAFLRDAIPCVELPTTLFNSNSEKIKVFPNPTNNFLQIVGIENLENYSFEISDMSGRTKAKNIQAREHRIRLPELQQGQYILTGVNTDANQIINRLINIH